MFLVFAGKNRFEPAHAKTRFAGKNANSVYNVKSGTEKFKRQATSNDN